MDPSPSHSPPASDFPESITRETQTERGPTPPPQAVSPPTNDTARREPDLLQDIKQAIDQLKWQYVREQIKNHGPDSYENLAGAALRFLINATNNTCDHKASILDTVKAIVEMAPSEYHRNKVVNRKQYDGRTLLHLLVSFPRGDKLRTNLTDYLVCNGAIATARDNNGQTPLHIAAEYLCEENIRVFLKHLNDASHTLYDNNLLTPLDCAIAACRSRIPDTAEVFDRAKLYSLVPEDSQRCIKSLEDYQDEKREVPSPKSASWNKYDTSSACESSVYVLRQHPGVIGLPADQLKTHRHWITLKRPVTEVLEGPESVMGEVRRRNEDFDFNFDPEIDAFPGFLTTWIHLSEHNVSEFDFPV